MYVHLGSNHVEWNTAIIRPTTVTGKSMVSKCGSTQEIGGCRNSGHRREKTRDQTAMIIIVGHTRDFYFSSLRPLGGFQNSPGTCVRSWRWASKDTGFSLCYALRRPLGRGPIPGHCTQAVCGERKMGRPTRKTFQCLNPARGVKNLWNLGFRKHRETALTCHWQDQ